MKRGVPKFRLAERCVCWVFFLVFQLSPIAGAAGDEVSPIIQAAHNKDWLEVGRLLQGGADPNSRYRNDYPLLTYVCEGGNAELAKELLALGAQVDARGNDGCTALMEACRSGRKECVHVLLQAGEDVNVRSTAEKYVPVMLAAGRGERAIVEMLLEAGADVSAKDKSGKTAFCWAFNNDRRDVWSLLLDKGADISYGGPEGYTPLILAAWKGKTSDVRSLLSKEAEVAATNPRDGYSALFVAAHGGHEEIVRLLLDAGARASVQAKDQSILVQGSNPMDTRPVDVGGITPLMRAAAQGHVGVCELLLDRGAEINAVNRCGNTPLMYAAFAGHDKVVDLLLKRGADFERKGKAGGKALYWASISGRPDVVTSLIKKGADIDAKVEGATASFSVTRFTLLPKDEMVFLVEAAPNEVSNPLRGFTPLMGAAFGGHWEVVKILLEHEAKVNEETGNGLTALEVARKKGHRQIQHLLESHGAK